MQLNIYCTGFFFYNNISLQKYTSLYVSIRHWSDLFLVFERRLQNNKPTLKSSMEKMPLKLD